VMLVDTVGFINKIPHSLVEAFKSTLEEVRSADLLLHLVDMTNPLFEEQVQVIEEVLKEIGAGEIPVVLAPNKIDAVATVPVQKLKNRGVAGVCPISALNRTGIAELLETIGAILEHGKERFHACFSASQGGLLSLLRERGRIVEESYEGDQVYVTAIVTPKLAGQIRKLLRTDRDRGQAPALN